MTEQETPIETAESQHTATEETETSANSEDNALPLVKSKQLANLNQELDSHKEQIKKRLHLKDDTEFDLLIRQSIIASFLELGIRLTPDDPIFAVVLSQKNVMDYYAHLISEALRNTPVEIGNTIEYKVSDIKEIYNGIIESLDAFGDELEETLTKRQEAIETGLNKKVLEINNTLVTSFNAFIDKKLEELNNAEKNQEEYNKNATKTIEEITEKSIDKRIVEFKNSIKNADPQRNLEILNTRHNSVFTKLIMIVLLLANLGLTSYIALSNSASNQKNIEMQYTRGLINGFSEIRKNFNNKDADKIEKTIVKSIDDELAKSK